MLRVSFNQYSVVEEQERNEEKHLKGLLVLWNSQPRKGVGHTLVVATSFLERVGGQGLPEDHVSILYHEVSRGTHIDKKEDAFSVWLYSRVYYVLTDAVVDLEAAAIATSSQGRE